MNLVRQKVNIKAMIFGGVAIFVAVMVVIQLPVHAANTFPNIYELVSVNSNNGQGVNNNATVRGVSADGNKILFSTAATNLPNSNTNSSISLVGGYVRDMQLGTTTRVDLSENGSIPDKSSEDHAMSITGRYVAFSSTASNLIDGTTLDNSVSRAYLKDLQTNKVEILTDKSGISNGLYAGFFRPVTVSDDGRFVLLLTNVVNSLISSVPNRTVGNYRDLVMYDRVKSTWTLINTPASGVMQNVDTGSYYSQGASASCDGAVIVFQSSATNLTNDHSGTGHHIFLADLRNGLQITDVTPGATADSTNPQISCNGRYITYGTKDRTVISPNPAGMDNYAHLVRYDRFTGERSYIDTKSDNTTYNPSQLGRYTSSVTDDGDVVLPYSSLTILGAYQTTVQFKHLNDASGTLENVQHNYSGLKYDEAYPSVVSPNGKYVVVSSKDGYILGLLNSASSTNNIIRIKTGL